jgi:hypothetical protein
MEYLHYLGLRADSQEIENLLTSMNTMKRPALDVEDVEEQVFADWVLIRRKGIEFGFTDSAHHFAESSSRWGNGPLILTQLYFYRAIDNVASYTGSLPFGLELDDSREKVRQKMSRYASTLHAHINDTWDTEKYRISVVYTQEEQEKIDRMAVILMGKPLPKDASITLPRLAQLIELLGAPVNSSEFRSVFENAVTKTPLKSQIKHGELNLRRLSGMDVQFAGSSISTASVTSIAFYGNRHNDTVEWAGELPHGLTFEDSPSVMQKKIGLPPVTGSDNIMTGYAVWNFPDYTLHVLYSNVYNRPLKISIVAPGIRKKVD